MRVLDLARRTERGDRVTGQKVMRGAGRWMAAAAFPRVNWMGAAFPHVSSIECLPMVVTEESGKAPGATWSTMEDQLETAGVEFGLLHRHVLPAAAIISNLSSSLAAIGPTTTHNQLLAETAH